MDGTVLPTLPELKLHVAKADVDAAAIVSEWLAGLHACLAGTTTGDSFAKLFIGDAWWRDILALGWEFTTKRGQDDIRHHVDEGRRTRVVEDVKACEAGGLKPSLVEFAGQAWVQSAFTFRTQHGSCRGYVRLENDAEKNWKAWTVFTELEELHYQKELEVKRRQSRSARKRPQQANGTHASEDLDVLIVGAGQAGVSLGARLKHMGIRALLVERYPAVGDTWRARYDSVTLNTPTFTDHYPFVKYPESWPEWLTGSQAADWLEHYSQLMGLDVLVDATVTSVQRTDDHYTVTVESGEQEKTFHPRHVVLATGVYGDTPVTPQFPGQESFRGDIYHSSQRKSARLIPDLAGKSAVVIGCSTSGHDAAQDLVECGARHVSMIQRHPIFTLSTDSWKTLQLGLWDMPGLTTEEADLVGNSLPIAVVRSMSVGLTQAMAAADAEMLAGLRAAGMALRTGGDGYGLADHQLILGGHYYIDQGACAMIADGRVKVHRCEGGVARLTERSVELADGRSVEADVVVLATGFEGNMEHVRGLMGDEVADRLVGFGELDEEQERRGWWRPTGVEGFWYMTGSFMWCRQFSRALALQIAGKVKGYY
ncbi:Monooxygenase [Cordyceps fumosorosea ARSEF 2679]|uniref:Monooxygenase n=1 Tax=Cordyceps fumosorosea (strain ARSEF 2679) TaxID=1081104 RepID=A0A168DCA1_CORFA|nr:Monooxygenase [Cordyceps fumosorosea ARSEF 2679]OAA72428.1 Monooxygenase [Cordyceps fumosorosea ARSEF 2679]